MDPFFIWLEQSALSSFLTQTDSVFVFPAILVLHAVGMALLVGNLVSTSFIHIHLISAFFWLLFGMAARAGQNLGQQDV